MKLYIKTILKKFREKNQSDSGNKWEPNNVIKSLEWRNFSDKNNWENKKYNLQRKVIWAST